MYLELIYLISWTLNKMFTSKSGWNNLDSEVGESVKFDYAAQKTLW